MNKFQERLQELLEDNNLSRLQLSKNIGISFETLNGYFNKNFYPELSIAVKLSNYFNCSIHYLLGLTDDEKVNDNNNLTFIETLKKLIKEKHISVKKLMDNLNMSENNFYRWQRNTTKPSMDSLIALANFFDVSIDYLIGREK